MLVKEVSSKEVAGLPQDKIFRCLFLALSSIGIVVSVVALFQIRIFGYGFVGNGYFYLLYAIYIPLAFLAYPGRKQISQRDILFAVLSFGASFFLFLHAEQMLRQGWEAISPWQGFVAGAILLGMLLVAARRASGLPFALICLVFALFPLYTAYLPAVLKGVSFDIVQTISRHSMGCEAIVGIPMRVFGQTLIGFILFGVALMSWGGGAFFLNLALALLGHMRGGPAKVSIFASGLFGSMSGSVVSNVVTTGSVTIPAMKKTGYPPYYAAAIESCASTGGCFMPPIMGATAFVIASFLGLPYYKIAIAAVIPALLYYLGIFMQTDFFAAKTGIKGLPREEIPSIRKTLKDGWVYIFAFVLLIYLLVYERIEVCAPYYATGALFILCMIRRQTRLNVKSLLRFIEESGKILGQLCAILGAVGFIIGSLSITGVAHAFASEVLILAGGNLALLLILGALTSIVLGMGMTVTACYILLAIVLAPALINIGLFPLSVHLFVMYCGMISFITPPVAIGAYAAAGIAGASPMKTAFQAMRLGIVIYFIPFFFVLNPALIGNAPPLDILTTTVTCAAGIILIAGAIEGYMLKLGKIGWLSRVLLMTSGVLLGIPELYTDIIGAALLGVVLISNLVRRKFWGEKAIGYE